MTIPIRLALSGGGMKVGGLSGSFSALTDHGFSVAEVAGTSAGAIMAGLIASGMTAADIKELAFSVDFANFISFEPFKIWSTLFARSGYCSGDVLHHWLDAKMGGHTFKTAPIPCLMVASDLVTGHPFVFSRETTPDVTLGFAARCSASIPFIYGVMKWNGYAFVDGGIKDNLPADRLVQDAVPRWGIRLTDKTTMMVGLKTGISIGLRLISMMMSTLDNQYQKIDQFGGTQVVDVDTSAVGVLDLHPTPTQRKILFQNGYCGVVEALAAAVK
ncbi:MAG: patatin-like phospholipase family protein [Sulfobacillus sp.]